MLINFVDFDSSFDTISNTDHSVSKFFTMSKTSNTKAKILTTAGRLFARRGYFGTSMDDIAREVGIGKSALYYYFDSKEQLCKKLMRKNMLVLKKNLRQAAKQGSTPFDTLLQVILVLLDFRIKHPEINLLTTITGYNDQEEPIIRYIVKMRIAVIKLIRELIGEIDITRKRGCKFKSVFSASLLGFIFGPFVPTEREINSRELAKQLTRYSLTMSQQKSYA